MQFYFTKLKIFRFILLFILLLNLTSASHSYSPDTLSLESMFGERIISKTLLEEFSAILTSQLHSVKKIDNKAILGIFKAFVERYNELLPDANIKLVMETKKQTFSKLVITFKIDETVWTTTVNKNDPKLMENILNMLKESIKFNLTENLRPSFFRNINVKDYTMVESLIRVVHPDFYFSDNDLKYYFGKDKQTIIKHGAMPVHLSLLKKHFALTNLLINHGADVEKRSTGTYYKPMQYALNACSIDLLNLLLHSGASTFYLTDKGQSALSLSRAIGKYFLNIAPILEYEEKFRYADLVISREMELSFDSLPFLAEKKYEQLKVMGMLRRQECIMQLLNDPKEFKCPLSNKLISEPYIAKDGFTYENSEIRKHFQKSNRSPVTGEIIIDRNMYKNYKLNSLIDLYRNNTIESCFYYIKSLIIENPVMNYDLIMKLFARISELNKDKKVTVITQTNTLFQSFMNKEKVLIIKRRIPDEMLFLLTTQNYQELKSYLAEQRQLVVNMLLEDPAELCCPISMQLLSNAVIASDGHTYESNMLHNAFKVKDIDELKSPLTKSRLETKKEEDGTISYLMHNQAILEILVFYKLMTIVKSFVFLDMLQKYAPDEYAKNNRTLLQRSEELDKTIDEFLNTKSDGQVSPFYFNYLLNTDISTIFSEHSNMLLSTHLKSAK
ncbi:U-box domain-containing protein [bacterium]